MSDELKPHQKIKPAKLMLADMMYRKGYNNTRLSKETGIRPTTIANYKANLCDSVKLTHIAIICKVLDCEIGELVKLDE